MNIKWYLSIISQSVENLGFIAHMYAYGIKWEVAFILYFSADHIIFCEA